MAYHAFLSYSHADDGRLSQALHAGLHRFAKPWYRLRAVRVFRDKASLSINPGLWPEIERALGASGVFLLLASPGAAASPWVQREVAHWLERGLADRLLIILTRGELQWDARAGAFDRQGSDALPPQLLAAYRHQPLHLDLRWARAEEQLTLQHPQFRESIAAIAAVLLGRPKDELLGDDVRHHRRARRLAMMAVLVLLLLTGFSILAAMRALRESRIAVAREIAARAMEKSDEDPELALLLARESLRRSDTAEGEESLRMALLRSHDRRALRGHSGSILTARLSEDGSRVLTLSADRTVKIWDLATAAPRVDIRGFSNRVSVVQWSEPAGLVMTVCPEDADTRIWDAATGSERFRFRAGLATLSPNGWWLAMEAEANQVRLVEPGTGKRLADLGGHRQAIVGLECSPDGRLLASSGRDGSVRIWDVAGRQAVATVQAHTEAVGPVVFSPDSERFITLGERDAILWSCRTGAGLATNSGPIAFTGAQFSRDGLRLVTLGANSDTARIWEAATGRLLKELRGHADTVHAAAFSPDGRWVVTGSTDGTARVWDAQSGRCLSEFLDPRGEPRTVLFLPDSRQMLTAGLQDVVWIWELALSDRISILRGHTGGVESAFFTPDGLGLVSLGGFGDVILWDPMTAMARHRFFRRAAGAGAAVSADGRRMATLSPDSKLEFWDSELGTKIGEGEGSLPGAFGMVLSPSGSTALASRQDRKSVLFQVPGGRRVAELAGWKAAYASDGSFVLVWGSDDLARLYATDTGRVVSEFPAEKTSSDCVMVSPHGRFVVSSVHGRGASLCEGLTGRTLARLEKHDWAEFHGTFSPDERRVAASGPQFVTRIWEVPSGRLLHELNGHTSSVWNADFSPDGRYLATASQDETVRVWEVATGRCVSVIRDQVDGVNRATFSPDSRFLVTAGRDGTVRILPDVTFISGDDLLRRSERRVERVLSSWERRHYLHERVRD